MQDSKYIILSVERFCVFLASSSQHGVRSDIYMQTNIFNHPQVKRLQSALQHRDTQYKHEVKKKERELSKLKDRLNQLLNDRSGGRKTGIQMSTALQRVDGKRGTWKTGGQAR